MTAKRPRHPKGKTSGSAQSGSKLSSGEKSKSGAGLENEGFVVDLFLDREKQVRLTQVLHVKTGVGESWEEWDERRLVSFFVEHSGICVQSVESETRVSVSSDEEMSQLSAQTAQPATVESDVAAPLEESELRSEEPDLDETGAGRLFVAGAKESSADSAHSDQSSEVGLGSSPDSTSPKLQEVKDAPSKLMLNDLAMIPARAAVPSRLLKSGEDFEARLSFDLADSLINNGDHLIFSASVVAKRLGESASCVLAKGEGMMKIGESVIIIKPHESTLPPGVYRLQAYLEVRKSITESFDPPVRSSIGSGFLQIY
jgi:hypothetical protein